ncbi:MAG TPA: caspase family protein [Candidatus Dormibacteraeota bacterium]|nr:caspase family protein [Candidatus Dormibacteraeota bacterium]
MGVALAIGLWQTTTLDRAFPLPKPTAVQTSSGAADGPVLWVLAVGVSHYASPDLNLQFADADAKAIGDALQQAARRGPYREVRTMVLTDAEVTRESMLSGLSKFLGQAGPDDVAVLFVAGHGVRDLDSGSYYFLPYPANADTLLADGLRMSDFDESLKVLRRNIHAVIVMLDTCHAGSLGIPAAAAVSADEMARQMTTGEGFFLLAASKPGEQSKERSGLNHGVFTYALLEGIEGQGDADADGALSVSELFGYVARRVPQLTGGGQHPYNKMEGTDLVLLNVGAVTPRPAPVLPPQSEPREGEPSVDNVIGVLGFQNLRQDPSYSWISQALRLAFNTELSKVKALRVYSPELIDRTTRARGTDPLVTARELGIGRLLTGAYYVSDKTLRIDARIVDARTGVNEASDSVEGQLDEFFDLQKRLVLSMLRRLRVQLSPEEGQSIEKQTNTDVDAYRLLLESEGIVEPSPRAERTQPKRERHSTLERALDKVAAALWPAAYGEDVPPEVEQQVREMLERYRRAVESKNLDEVAGTYATFSERQRTALHTYLDTANDLAVEISDVTITPHEGGLLVSFVRRDHFTDASSGRPVRLEVRLTKVLVREQSSWKIGSGQ